MLDLLTNEQLLSMFIESRRLHAERPRRWFGLGWLTSLFTPATKSQRRYPILQAVLDQAGEELEDLAA